MKKLTGPKIYDVKGKIRKLVNFRLDMEEAGVNNIRKIIKNSGVSYMTAIGWVQKIKAEEKLRRTKKRILG